MSADIFGMLFSQGAPTLPGGADRVLPQLLHAIRGFFGMEIAFISHFSNGRRYFQYIDSSLEEPGIRVGGSDPLEDSYCQAVVEQRLPELIRDAQTLEAAEGFAATKAFPVGAHISVPLVLPNHEVYGTFCCFSRSPDESLNPRDLELVHVFADIAAEVIGNKVQLDAHRSELRERLEAVLDGGLLSLVYQPIYDILDNQLVGFESLSRIRHEPYRTPDVWFQEAMEVGLHNQLELRAVKVALEALPHLPSDAYLSVNLSPRVIFENDLVKTLQGHPLDRLVLEVTEHDVVENYDALMDVLGPLRRAGLRLAVDDAGAGYSSLRHILQMVPDIIKLDISITRNIDKDGMRRSLARGLLSFTNSTGIRLIAEGVDSPAELATLKSIGARYSQGYLLSKPLTVEQLSQANLWSSSPRA